jgi:hypothetical protein
MFRNAQSGHLQVVNAQVMHIYAAHSTLHEWINASASIEPKPGFSRIIGGTPI